MSLRPREYQQRIADAASLANTLVVLPTGLGKTMIAVLVAKARLEKFPKGKVVVLAPTKPRAGREQTQARRQDPRSRLLQHRPQQRAPVRAAAFEVSGLHRALCRIDTTVSYRSVNQ